MTQSKYQYFTQDELQCHGKDCCGGQSVMNHNFMVKLVSIRRELGLALPISSSYRCPIHNSSVSKTGESGPHTTGRAVDISCRGTDAYKIIECALRYGMTGIGVKQNGENRFIHIDDLDGELRPWIWSY